ncbi:hypothetical protein [Ensifer sp. LCM 4579]|uniref:hypothetical protein n=1 Tax=Ensifer sp. LCM 4579 TaxID=1848292 RepID=UPI0008D8F55F|nr:hypothetical protein [Ensifer sp. LCM 4579]OHV73351.1 hypothetical protein LCM4579_10545 [Ensifer sp. LCM 4579]
MEQNGNSANHRDPLIAAVAAYRDHARRFNELPDTEDDNAAATRTHASYDRLCRWNSPLTREGALAALLFIRDGDMIEEDAGHTMLSAAIKYLEAPV